MEKKTQFRVEGMDCASCAAKVEAAVRRLGGVTAASVSLASGRMTVTHAADRPVAEEIVKVLPALGYTAHLEAEENHAGHMHGAEENASGVPWWKRSNARLALASGAAMAAAYGAGAIFPRGEKWFCILALLVGLVPVARRAWATARHGTVFSIETLMTVSAAGAVVIGAAEEAMMVVFLFLLGELLEGVTAERARASIRGLVELMPRVAWRRAAGDGFVEVAAEELRVGDVIQVRPGDRVAADGVVREGAGEINEAPVTGESVPRRKTAGDPVYAGTVNGAAVLLVEVSATAADNTIARIIRLVEEAQESKAPLERFMDRFARRYTPVVFGLGLATALVPPLLFGGDWREWIYKGLALLLIGCPCALVISTPTAIAASLSAGARRGLLMKGGVVLETLGKLRLIAFDKTGTLTAGTPQVTDVVAEGSFSAKEILARAAVLEAGSNHPLARAILAKNQADGATAPAAKEMRALAGKGVAGEIDGTQFFLGSVMAAKELAGDWSAAVQAHVDALAAQGKTVSVLLAGEKVGGVLALRDELRPDTAAGIAALRDRGIRTVMLSGDNRQTAEAIGKELGMEVRAELLPEEKSRQLAELKAALRPGECIGLVGDGINDAPALAAADVGIAMGSGTDVALETADAAVLHSSVSDVARMVALSWATLWNIRQNIACALGLKGIFLCTTLLGITGLWPAILADTGATVLVTLNAMRLLRWRGN